MTFMIAPSIDPRTLAETPHAAFAALRAQHPVIRIGEGPHYLILAATGLDDFLSDPRTRQVEGAEYVRLNAIPDGVTADLVRDFFLFANGAEHRAKRALFARTFSHSMIRAARPIARGVADAIVGDLPGHGCFDFVETIATRLPAEMIAQILGLPNTDAPFFSAKVYELARSMSPIYPSHDHHLIEAAASDLRAYVSDQIRDRMRQSRDDVLSHLTGAWQSDMVLPFDEFVTQVIGLIAGGIDTVRGAFAMLVALLLQHPDDWNAVTADPGLIPGAVAESLRFEPSVASIARFVTAPIEFCGVTIPAGALVRISTMSAMRDPALYAEPDRFDIRRTDHPRLHMVFGQGPHRCIGEMLARMEMEEGLEALIARAPALELISPPDLSGFGGIRAISPMRVRIPEGREAPTTMNGDELTPEEDAKLEWLLAKL